LILKVLGAGREVGRAAILLKPGDKAKGMLLDYGVNISTEVPRFPEHVAPRDLLTVALTHAHLDHSGGIPLLYVSVELPLLTTPLTLSLAELLVRDFLKISKYYVPFEIIELLSMMRNARIVNLGEAVDIGPYHVEIYSAGHIPGSSMFLVEVEGLRILYTGDFNLEDTCLLRGADMSPFKKADVVIMEATYASYDHPNRALNEAIFIEKIREVVEDDGTVLIPAFAVGRSQEIACVLCKYEIDAPVYLDGMARYASAIIEEHADTYLRDASLYRKAISAVSKVTGAKMRRRISRKPGIIISSAGMLKGGAAVYYMERIMENPKNAVFFVSFQVPDSPGRKVLQEGVFVSPRKAGKVEARVEWFDFSSHCGRTDLIRAVELTRSSSTIVVVHSEEKGGKEFVEYISDKLRREVLFPRSGETIKL